MRCSSCGREVPDGSRYCPFCGAPLLQHTALTLQVADPDRVLCDRYIVLDRLGGGGYGTVYRAKDTQLDEFIALKVLPAELITDNTAVERMREEVRIAKKLRHDNIAAVYDFQIDRAKNRCFITMELVDGKNLFTLLREKGKFDLQEVLPIVEQVASALDYAHRKGVIHRDIKPHNIMAAKDGTVKVTDFGIAKRLRDEASRVSQTQPLGTPAYMAPEHLLGEKIGREADIYSLAATVYELLSGHTPYQGSQEQIIAQVVKGKKVEPIKGVPDYVNEALLKGLSHNPADRPHSATQFYNMLFKPKTPAKRQVAEEEETPYPTREAVKEDRVSSVIKQLKDEDEGVRVRAAEAPGEIGYKRAFETFIKLLKDKDKGVRWRAAEALGKIGDERAVEPLIEVLEDEDFSVCSAAAEALGRIGDRRAVQPLIEALKDEDEVVRDAAAWALGEIGDKRAVEPLIKALKDEDKFVRASAAVALGEIGDKRAVEPLIEALKDEDESYVRMAAAWALEEITGEDFGTDYRKWRRWWRRQKY